MNDIVKLIVDNGIGVICVGYLIYFSLTTMKDMQRTMTEMSTSLKLMNQDIEEIKEKINVKSKNVK